MLDWRTKCRWDTGYSADSVEWCPVQPYTHVLVCGTYQLSEAEEGQPKQKRLGKIYLFTVDEDTTELNPIQTIETSGVLDQKWCYHFIESHPVLAVVTSEGLIQLYRLIDKEGILNLELWLEEQIGRDLLALSIDWSSNKSLRDPSIVVSDSSGSVTLWRVEGKLTKEGEWNSHGFEAWIAAFNYWSPNVFYSGGDDCVFKSYDTRLSEPVTTNRSHEAGVTAIRSHVEVEHQLLTGSYDEQVRVWDARSLKRCITETDVNGGVWRLKWHPRRPNIILAACMYGGFRVLHMDDQPKVVSEYLEHESIAYGADWSSKGLIATCSFYDCKMHISEVILDLY
ncbi:diphthine methyltransferase isoform X1 [Aricia agestis]|nr:diphthine methyltransferase isoform X1 [Aricia agestis]XP_041978351.1 diphthine methyltransferase isoform X1 [Aricia agestis]